MRLRKLRFRMYGHVGLILPLISWAAAQGPARIVVYLKSLPDFSPGRLLKEMVRIDLSALRELHLIFGAPKKWKKNPGHFLKKWGTLEKKLSGNLSGNWTKFR